MGAIIKAVGTARPLFRKGIIPLSKAAASKCLKDAGTGIREIGMLINTGVYNESHMGEPALASLVLESLKHRMSDLNKEETTLSFDLHNGGGGIIDAFRVLNVFMNAGRIKYGLIVSGDTKPLTGTVLNYSYDPGSGAILLSGGSEGKGFIAFESVTYPEFIDDLKSTTDWDSGLLRHEIIQNKRYLESCIYCIKLSVKKFLEKTDMPAGKIDLVISSHSPRGLRERLNREEEFKSKVILNSVNGELYSAGLIFSISTALKNGSFKAASNILFITAGAGITVTMALYRN